MDPVYIQVINLFAQKGDKVMIETNNRKKRVFLEAIDSTHDAPMPQLRSEPFTAIYIYTLVMFISMQ